MCIDNVRLCYHTKTMNFGLRKYSKCYTPTYFVFFSLVLWNFFLWLSWTKLSSLSLLYYLLLLNLQVEWFLWSFLILLLHIFYLNSGSWLRFMSFHLLSHLLFPLNPQNSPGMYFQFCPCIHTSGRHSG